MVPGSQQPLHTVKAGGALCGTSQAASHRCLQVLAEDELTPKAAAANGLWALRLGDSSDQSDGAGVERGGAGVERPHVRGGWNHCCAALPGARGWAGGPYPGSRGGYLGNARPRRAAFQGRRSRC